MTLKEKTILHCANELENSLNAIKLAMNSAQGSANEEEKSTAGDKHDTARAMSHLETEMNSKQLTEAQMAKALFASIDFNIISKTVQIGSLVIGSHQKFLIAVGIGIIEIDNHKIAVCSPQAPIAQAMLGKKIGDTVVFGSVSFDILEIN